MLIACHWKFQNMGLYETETCSYPSTNTSKCVHHSTQISVKVLYRCSMLPQARILWQFCKKPASMNTITITYMFINSGVQTFREPFAALSRSFATAAKTHIHMCRCHSDTKSLAWVLERLPFDEAPLHHTPIHYTPPNHDTTTATPLRYNCDYSYSTTHYIQHLWVT